MNFELIDYLFCGSFLATIFTTFYVFFFEINPVDLNVTQSK